MNDWRATINEALKLLLKKYFAGTPPMNLFDYTPGDEDEPWRIPGLLHESINVIYGEGGTGKSYVAIILGQAIQYGIPVCGLQPIKGNVCLIDYETTPVDMRKRLLRVNAGFEVSETSGLLYIPAAQPIVHMENELMEYIVKHDISFLIIDALSQANAGSLQDDESIKQTFQSIRRLQTSCLLIHHTNKGNEYFGSAFIKNYARNLWRLQSAKSTDQKRMSIQLQQEKENDGPNNGNLGFLMEFFGDDPNDVDSVTLRLQNAALIPELRKHARLWQQLATYLSEAPNNRLIHKDIPDMLQLGKSARETYRSYIWALVSDNHRYKKLEELMHVEGDWLCLNVTDNFENPFEEDDFEEEWPLHQEDIVKQKSNQEAN